MATPRKKTERRDPAQAKPAASAGRSSRKRSGAGAKKAAAKAEPAKKARAAGPASPDDMPADVIEFLTAMDEYKRKNARPFPSLSEILEVLKGLGYRKAG